MAVGVWTDDFHRHTPQIQQRIYRAVEVLAQCRHKHEQIALLRAEFGISWRQATRYLRAARLINIEAIKGDREALVAQSYQTYMSIIADPDAEHRDKIKAQEAIDRLLGLSAPYKLAPTNPQGDQSWQPQTAEDLRGKLIERLSEPSRQ